MSPPVIALFAVHGVSVVLLIILMVQAFRTHVGWGLTALLPLVPFVCGLLHIQNGIVGLVALPGLVALAVFAIKHQKKAGILFLLYVGCLAAGITLLVTSPAVIAFYGRFNPQLAALTKTVNPSAYEAAQKLSPTGDNASGGKSPGAKPTPHEVRDLAENETPEPTPATDPNAAPRTAYVKHARELNTLFQQLDAERPKLKPGSPAVAAFNAKAAHYQQGLQTLAEEKAHLDALDHAATALATLQTSVQSGDYETFAAVLKKALSDYRQTPAFPQIAAFARSALQQATPDKVLAGLQTRAAAAVHADFDKTTRQIQGIVNQVPQIVPKPPEGAEVFHYSYHAGANKPDYNAENLAGTRELWKGQYVYMEEAPGVYYRAGDCEFNPQTKFFYTSRNVPKKRLNDAEYKELVRLYHQLGQEEKALANVPSPTRDAERVSGDLAALKAQLDGYAMK